MFLGVILERHEHSHIILPKIFEFFYISVINFRITSQSFQSHLFIFLRCLCRYVLLNAPSSLISFNYNQNGESA